MMPVVGARLARFAAGLGGFGIAQYRAQPPPAPQARGQHPRAGKYHPLGLAVSLHHIAPAVQRAHVSRRQLRNVPRIVQSPCGKRIFTFGVEFPVILQQESLEFVPVVPLLDPLDDLRPQFFVASECLMGRSAQLALVTGAVRQALVGKAVVRKPTLRQDVIDINVALEQPLETDRLSAINACFAALSEQ